MDEAACTPQFGTLLIHGVGLIGGSLGMAARRYGLADQVVGVGRDPAKLQKAVALGAIHRFVDESEIRSEYGRADVIVLCTPVSKIVHDLPAVLTAAGASTVVTDVGSVKGVIVEAAMGDPRFVGGHPMAGSELAGVEAARGDLFQEATWAITPVETTSPATLAKVRWLAQSVGASTRMLAPAMHDQAVALTSHLPHLLAYTLASQAAARAAGNPDLPSLAAGSFADATRVAASLPSLWLDILTANRHAVSDALKEYRGELERYQAALDSGDDNELWRLLEEGHEAKGAFSA